MSRFDRLLELFDAATAATDPAERERILIDGCGDDAAMLAELRQLIATEVPPDFLEQKPPPQQLGEYHLLHELDQGGAGVVWVAHQPALDRKVAIKVLASGPGTSRAQIERFHREALAVSRLEHAHIVPIHGQGETQGLHWFAMQLVDGHSLAQEIALQRESGPDGRRPLLPTFGTGAWFAAIAGICADAADALQYAHQNELVHRDIKPQNLLLDQRSNVLIVDFGIARDERLGSLTETGTIAGSWPYMSPEQARIEKLPVDHRTDIYSLGVVLYELLTLTRPHQGTTSQEVIDSIRRAPPRAVRLRNPGAPRDLETICMAAMARMPAERYATAAALRDDLRRFLDHQTILRQPPSLPARLRQWLRHRRRPITLAATALIALGLGTTVPTAVIAAGERSMLIRRCEALLRAEDLGNWSEVVLASLWRDLRGAAAAPEVVAARTRLQGYRDELLAQCRQQARSPVLDPSPEDRAAATLRNSQLVWRAQSLDPSTPIPADLLGNPFFAAVDLAVVDPRGGPLAANVGVAFVDSLTTLPEPERDLGPAPIEHLRLRAGLYHFHVRGAAFGERVFTRQVELQELRTFQLPVYPIADPTAGMVLVPEGILHLEADGPPSGLAGTPTRVPAFYLDRCEVSVGEYRQYLRSTGRSAPYGFDQLGPEMDRRPVAFVTSDQALAYAEWAGKRLPSLAEWMLAARGSGPSPRRFPWVDDDLRGNANEPADFDGTNASRLAAYQRHTVAVDSTPLSCTPLGIFELLGNVEEWTESFGIDRNGDVIVARADRRVVVGGPWFRRTPDSDLRIVQFADSGPLHASYCRGFRCARSTSP